MRNKASLSDYFSSLFIITIALLFFSWRLASISLFLFSLTGLSGLFLLEALKESRTFYSYQQLLRGIALLVSIPLLFYLIKPAG
ncbi:ABC-type amino acid transport system permease subunit [Gracilibacillus halotolerans]|uniref:ABC-type amino acid transport system permease subunit n=1 Tax=Gracilibacillus halotolerans TaxID=74386 RepID=A0A841RMB3_9BACI|nr:hypothetical protein [Gracilibacillus halotolerans]MBB6513062.1 ABC-type amino acid transport system permease subunit [Gracilibacillus halotolerans]